MNLSQIAQQRLINQQLAASSFNDARGLVEWMVAMQAQEYAMAKWAIGLRTNQLNDAQVEDAFNKGEILRTHIMRPTWHFVTPADIRWLLALTAPRIHALSAFYYRRAELDAKIFRRTNHLIEKALEGGKFLTRTEIQSIFEKAKIKASGERLSYIMIQAELEGLICSGPKLGKQFSYALLEERVLPVKKRTRQEALANFVQRYFASRGPATLQDFSYWSGLTLTDAKNGAEALPSSFLKEKINGQEYIFQPVISDGNNKNHSTFLMPDYDEYGMSYKDRSALQFEGPTIKGSTVYSHWLVIDGTIRGTWKKTETVKSVSVEPIISGKLSQVKSKEVKAACKRYEEFFNTVSKK